MKSTFIILLTVSLLPTACVRNEPPPIVEAPAPSVEPAPLTSPLPELTLRAPESLTVEKPSQLPLAQLEAFLPRVNYRRKRELLWQDALLNLPLFPYDALRTFAKAGATILFDNGSDLYIEEDSLVILSPHLHIKKFHRDRAVVRSGNVKARTKDELWLLTSAAILSLKPKKNGAQAVAKLQIKEGEKLRVTVEEGEGKLLVNKKPALALTLGKEEQLAAPLTVEALGFSELVTAPLWEEQDSDRNLASLPKKEKPQVKPLELFITDPPNYSQTARATIPMSGRVSGAGGKVLINGRAAKLSAANVFSETIPLNEGNNVILVQLIRPDGESVYKRWMVFRKAE